MTRPEPEGGSITAFSVLLLVALVALLGLVVDGGRAVQARQAAQDEAEQAARAGAGALSVSALRSGQLMLDQEVAIQDAVAYTVRAGHPGSARVNGGVVTVTVTYRIPTDVLGIVGIDSMSVTGSASAVNVHGVTRGD